MADLDDFFAKRDKKKKAGGNKKFDTAEDLAKILGKKVEERKKMEEGKSQYVPEGDGQPPAAPANEDDEWINAEEKKPDLTGLKIQELILDSEDEEERKEQEVGEGGEVKMSDGVWGKKKGGGNVDESSTKTEEQESSRPSSATVNNAEDSEGTTSKSAAEVTKEAEKTVVDQADPSSEIAAAATPPSSEAPPAGPAKYVPAHMRNRPQESAATPPPSSRDDSDGGYIPAGSAKSAYVPPGRRAGATVASVSGKPKRPTAAPTITDEESFPSLGGS